VQNHFPGFGSPLATFSPSTEAAALKLDSTPLAQVDSQKPVLNHALLHAGQAPSGELGSGTTAGDAVAAHSGGASFASTSSHRKARNIPEALL
jgi:hypothetical protein